MSIRDLVRTNRRSRVAHEAMPPQEPNNEEAGPIGVTAGLADSSTGKAVAG